MTQPLPLRFALVGCGRIAARYVRLFSEGLLDGALLAAVCDIVPARANALAKLGGCRAYVDMHEMMQEIGAELDVVCILTPSGLHAQHCQELAPYGRHLVVEKPMALRVSDAEEMMRVCDQHGVNMFIVKQNRFNKAVRAAYRELEAGRFGKLVLGTVRVRWCRRQEYYDQDAWRGTWEMDGGVLANQAIHHIDLLQWMMGEPVSVFAYAETALSDIEAEDTAVCLIRFANGAVGVIEATTATRPKDIEGSLSILGEKGAVEIGGFAVNEILQWQFEGTDDGLEHVIPKEGELPPDVYGFGHREFLNNVIASVAGVEDASVDGVEGIKSLKLVSAIYESIVTGREVRLPVNNIHHRLGLPRQSPNES